MKVLIVGCGDLGGLLAASLQGQSDEHWDISGLRRDTGALTPGIRPVRADVTRPDSLALLAKEQFDVLVFTLTPGEYSDERYRQVYVQGLANCLARVQGRPLVLLVSSTSVYHQCDGEWVDETSPCQPSGFAGRRLLEAEQLLSSSGLPFTIVRFAGIYGPGRNRMLAQLAGGSIVAPEPLIYSNRIHSHDCAGFLAHLLNCWRKGEALESLYLGVDSKPASLWEVQSWLAGQLGLSPQQQLAARTRGSKRCRNQRLLDSGYRLLYPDYRSGYAALLASRDCP